MADDETKGGGPETGTEYPDEGAEEEQTKTDETKERPKARSKVRKTDEKPRPLLTCPWDGKAFGDAKSLQGHILGAHLQQGTRSGGEDTPSEDTVATATGTR